MQELTITKISLSGGMFPVVSYEENLPNFDKRTHKSVDCKAPAHPDLVKAFYRFVPHLALISERITNEQFVDAIENEDDATAPSGDLSGLFNIPGVTVTAMKREGDAIVEMSELVPAIKASRGKKKKAKAVANVPVRKVLGDFDLISVDFPSKNGIQSIVLNGQSLLSTGKWMGLGPTPPVKENDEDYKYTSDLFQLGELVKYEMTEYIVNHKYAPATDPELPFGNGPEIKEEQF